MRKFSIHLTILLLVGFLFGLTVNSKEIPSPSGPVIDRAGVLREKEKTKISRALNRYREQSGNDIRIYLSDSLEGENIAEYTEKVAAKWQLTTPKKRSILFFLALEERKMRLEVAPNLQKVLTSNERKEIIDQLVPFFKEEDYGPGVIHLGQELIKEIDDNSFAFYEAMKRNESWLPEIPAFAEFKRKDFYPIGVALLFLLFVSASGRRLFPRRSYIGKRRYQGPKNGGTSGSW